MLVLLAVFACMRKQIGWLCFFFFSSRRRHTICALVTGVQTCALPICAAGTPALCFSLRRRTRLTLSSLDRRPAGDYCAVLFLFCSGAVRSPHQQRGRPSPLIPNSERVSHVWSFEPCEAEAGCLRRQHRYRPCLHGGHAEIGRAHV